jgi:hypothetical protein
MSGEQMHITHRLRTIKSLLASEQAYTPDA